MRSKSKGSRIMVSDFIDEQNGYLQLTDKEFEHANEKDPSIRKHTCQLLEYGIWQSERGLLDVS